MDFSVAITTYNRPNSIQKLITQVLQCSVVPVNILVIDSSEEPNPAITKLDNVTYLRSSHKNQPYQRYLAYLCCKTEVIIFLDDDLEVMDNKVFDVILNRLRMSGIHGVSVGVEYSNPIFEIMHSQVDNKSILFKMINFFSGVPTLKEGKIYLTGLAGPRPKKEGLVEHFNGPVMGFYKVSLGKLYNPVLFSLFEKKLAMGEDKVISMEVGLTSKLWFIPGNFFLHPPNPSTYYQDVQLFQRKVTYSRLYISLYFGKLKNYPVLFIYLHYYYFSAWRTALACMRFLTNPSKQRLDVVKGILQGVLLTFTLPFDAKKITPGINWQQDANRDASFTK